MSLLDNQGAADGPVAEHALDGFSLRDGDGEGMLLAVEATYSLRLFTSSTRFTR